MLTLINDDGFTVDKAVFQTHEILQDLNTLLDYMHNNGSRYMFAIMAESQMTKEIEVLINANLIFEDLIKFADKLNEIVKEKIDKNKCDCDNCKEYIEILRKKYNLGGADE